MAFSSTTTAAILVLQYLGVVQSKRGPSAERVVALLKGSEALHRERRELRRYVELARRGMGACVSGRACMSVREFVVGLDGLYL